MIRLIDNCCSCGREIDLYREKENDDYFFEVENDEQYVICKECKEKWDN